MARSNAGTTAWKDVVLAESQQQDGVLLEVEALFAERGYAAALSECGLAKSSVARKLW